MVLLVLLLYFVNIALFELLVIEELRFIIIFCLLHDVLV